MADGQRATPIWHDIVHSRPLNRSLVVVLMVHGLGIVSHELGHWSAEFGGLNENPEAAERITKWFYMPKED